MIRAFCRSLVLGFSCAVLLTTIHSGGRILHRRMVLGGTNMTLAGGAASKAGNRYERRWIILKLIDVLEEKAQSVQPEVPGPQGDGTDMLVIEGTELVWHQVKHQPGSDAWTITRLARVGVLATC